MRLLLATNNTHKVSELKAILGNYFSEICSMKEAGLTFEATEDGATFEENALKKAVQTLAFAQDRFDAALADDSGLCVDALNGAPGVYSARFAGEAHDDAANNKYLMQRLSDIPLDRRGAQFVSCIALVRRGHDPICVRGTVSGTILKAPRGENGFGYDPYFYYEPLQKTFAELSADQKNSISHRSNALARLKEVLDGENCRIF